MPGLLYGDRLEGPFEPHAGHYFNINKLLVDPYARAIVRTSRYHPHMDALCHRPRYAPRSCCS